MTVRGVRGATTVQQDTPEEIINATRKLLEALMAGNPSMAKEDLASAIFSVTPDLTAAYPARAARMMGWTQVPLFCVQEIPVPDSLPACIRVLVHWNTTLSQNEIVHIYLGKAAGLRPDLISNQ